MRLASLAAKITSISSKIPFSRSCLAISSEPMLAQNEPTGSSIFSQCSCLSFFLGRGSMSNGPGARNGELSGVATGFCPAEGSGGGGGGMPMPVAGRGGGGGGVGGGTPCEPAETGSGGGGGGGGGGMADSTGAGISFLGGSSLLSSFTTGFSTGSVFSFSSRAGDLPTVLSSSPKNGLIELVSICFTELPTITGGAELTNDAFGTSFLPLEYWSSNFCKRASLSTCSLLRLNWNRRLLHKVSNSLSSLFSFSARSFLTARCFGSRVRRSAESTSSNSLIFNSCMVFSSR
ncbi:hypothetical protein OGATHE_004385 [Ogataea polymorpha]|uniref:Uncharacterized protein n=1 Tax=Ogataea polymorpha TaxID=460523 RepID=A0A9P8T247_9ASCO|nr:hypothetical protein OGATHE_004385 [Ogataea polymorpha]